MSEGRGQQKKSQEAGTGRDALWRHVQQKGEKQWVVGCLEEEAGEIMKICLVNDLEGGQPSKECRTMPGDKFSSIADVTVDGSLLCNPEY